MTTISLPISRSTSNLSGWIVLALGTALMIALIAVALLNMPAPAARPGSLTRLPTPVSSRAWTDPPPPSGSGPGSNPGPLGVPGGSGLGDQVPEHGRQQAAIAEVHDVNRSVEPRGGLEAGLGSGIGAGVDGHGLTGLEVGDPGDRE